jgi:ligand-binding sensor domain-containing protein
MPNILQNIHLPFINASDMPCGIPAKEDVLVRRAMIIMAIGTLCWMGTARSEEKWTSYTVADGLADNGVYAIAIDRQGLKWFGTRSGVTSFDGTTWKTYTTADGLASNTVTSIAVDAQNVKWFGTGRGVSRFDGAAWETYTASDGLLDDDVYCIAIDLEGIIWVGSALGVSRFDGLIWDTYTPENGLSSDFVFSVAVDQQGVRWFGTQAGVSRFDGTAWKNYTTVDGLAEGPVFTIAVDPENATWFGTSYGGASKFDGVAWKTYTSSVGLGSNFVNSIGIDAQGVLWFGTQNGLSRFDGTQWRTYATSDGLASNFVNAVVIDDQGVRWFGTEKGVSKLEEQIEAAEPPTHVSASDIPQDQGHRLKLTWTPSVSEQTGMVSWYRIYRSRSGEFSTPVPLSRFASLDSLIFHEQRSTILIDSVSVGKTEFIDPFVPVNGTPYYYWVQAAGRSGASKPVIAAAALNVKEKPPKPSEIFLKAAYPNPFNSSTVIEFRVPREMHVTVKVFNVSGQMVGVVANERVGAGRHSFVWSGARMPSGTYYCTVQAGSYIEKQKMLLIK